MRRREAGRGAAPAGFVATKHSGGSGAPPGATRSPRQELADVLIVALPASGLLGRNGQAKAGPAAGNAANSMRYRPPAYLSACGAPRGARVPQGTSYRFASFGAPIPSASRASPGEILRHVRHRKKEGTGVEKERPTREPLIDGKDHALRRGPDLPVVPLRRSQVPARKSLPRRRTPLRRAYGRLARGDR